MPRHDGDLLLRRLREICLALPDAEEYVMVHHPAFRVGTKPFAIAGLGSAGERATVAVNLGPELQAQLLSDERFSQTPYIGQHGWVTVGFADVPVLELAELVRDSYRRIAGKKRVASITLEGRQSKARREPKRSPRSAAAAARDRERIWRELGLAAPARRALVGAGLTSLRDLRTMSEAALRDLHGMGPTALDKLAVAMAEAKLRFARDPKR